jgi:hypothetical protein
MKVSSSFQQTLDKVQIATTGSIIQSRISTIVLTIDVGLYLAGRSCLEVQMIDQGTVTTLQCLIGHEAIDFWVCEDASEHQTLEGPQVVFGNLATNQRD